MNSTTISGITHSISILVPLGPYRLPIVYLSESLSLNSYNVCIDHFPNVCVPISVAPICSCRAIAIISPADAVNQSISIIIGILLNSLYHNDTKVSSGYHAYLAVVISFPSGMKCDAISTAIGNIPPPFHLKSSMIPCILLFCNVIISLLRRFSVSSPIIDMVMIPMFFQSRASVSLFTDGILIVSLMTSISSISLLSSCSPTLSMVNETVDHFGQRIRMTASLTVSSLVLSPSTAIIRSNGYIPALNAGDSLSTSSMST